MADIVTLGIKINSKEVKQADTDLDNLSKSSAKAETSTNKLTGATSKLSTALGAVVAAISVREIIQIADSYKLMEGRLKLVTTSSQNLATVQKELFNIAQDSRVSIESTVDLYARLARSTKSMGVSQKDLLNVTETINKSFIISGASADAANAAIMQLGQGFASGTLRGDELNSVLEQAPRLAEAIAKGMGVTVGQLRALGAEGKLTSDKIFNALQKQGDAIDSEFGQMPKTVSQALTQIENSFSDLVGTADKAINGTGGLSDVMSGFAEFMSENKVGILEFGNDFFQAMQMMGAGVVGITTGMMGVIDGIAGGVASTLQWMLNKLVAMINGALGLAETATNKVKSIFGGDQISLGKVSAFTFGDEMMSQAGKRFSESQNAFKTVGNIFKDIAKDSIVIADSTGKLEGATAKARNAGKAIPSKEEINKAEKLATAYKDINREISKTDMNSFEIEMDNIDKKAEEYKKLGISEIKIQEYVSTQKNKIRKKYDEEADNSSYEAQIKYIDDVRKADIESYKLRGDFTSAFYMEESDKIQKLAESGAYANEQLISIWENDYTEFGKTQNKLWDDLWSNISKGMDANFFDPMTGKFKTFGKWFKDFFSSIWNSILSGVSRTLADMLSGGAQGGIQNVFKTFGGLFTGSTTQLSASDIGSLGGTVGQAFTSSGGTSVDSSGNVLVQGSDLSSLMSLASIGSTLSSGLTSLLYAPSAGIGNLAGMAYGAGFTGTGSFLGGVSNAFAGGSASGLSGASFAGGMAGSGLMGGALGYGIGSLGDALFGAKTKAGQFGAIGGAAGGALGGPIGMVVGAILGSLIGGAFGSKKVVDSGVSFAKDSSAGSVDNLVSSFVTIQKKSWFSDSSKTSLVKMSQSEKDSVSNMFNTYDYLLNTLGSNKDIFIQAGNYSGNTFLDQLSKNFIDIIKTGGDTTEIYNAWKDYAKSINKTVTDALTESIGGYISKTRSFTEWSLGSGTSEQLSYTAKYLESDLKKLEDQMGVSGITAKNYLFEADKAIKSSFTPETITQWNNLGDAIMRSNDATKAYTDSLKQSESAQVNLTDMMLGKITDLSQNKTFDFVGDSKAIFEQLLKVSKEQLDIARFGNTGGIPA